MDIDQEAAAKKTGAGYKGNGNDCLNFLLGDPYIATTSDYLPLWAVNLYCSSALMLSMFTLFRYTLTGTVSFSSFSTCTLAGVSTAFFLGACSANTPSYTLNMSTSLLYHVFTSASLIATIYYWDLVYDGSGAYWYRIYPHGLALALLLIDIVFISAMEFRPWYIAVFLSYLFAYLTFMFINLAITK